MRHLSMFAKHWTPGQVKTRLAARIGAASAARLHEQFVWTLAARLTAVGDSRSIHYWPPDAEPDFARFADSWRLHPQVTGDLGARMEAFFAGCFSGGCERVVLIGSDSPTLPRAILDEAFDALEEEAVVLGPAEDGGYYLIGARERVPPIFRGVDWGTERVWEQTTALLTRAGIGYRELPVWFDVDRYDDLLRLSREPAEDAHCRALAADVREMLRREPSQ